MPSNELPGREPCDGSSLPLVRASKPVGQPVGLRTHAAGTVGGDEGPAQVGVTAQPKRLSRFSAAPLRALCRGPRRRRLASTNGISAATHLRRGIG